MTDLENYRILKVIDSNNVVLIAKQDTIIANLEYALGNRNSVIEAKDVIIKQKDIQLNLQKLKARRQKWIIGSSLGGAIVITLLSTLLTR